MSGLQVFNDSGVLQIDGEFRNMRLTGKGVLNVTQNTTPARWPFGQYFGNGTHQVLAWRSQAPVSQGNYTPTAGIVTALNYQLHVPFPAAIEYFIFTLEPPPPTNSGMQVWNQAGQLVFDSGDKQLRVIDAFEAPIPALNTESAPRVYPGKKIAVVQNHSSGQVSSTSVSGGRSVTRDDVVARVSGDSTLYTGYYRTMDGVVGSGPPFWTGIRTCTRPNYLVIDVTGY